MRLTMDLEPLRGRQTSFSFGFPATAVGSSLDLIIVRTRVDLDERHLFETGNACFLISQLKPRWSTLRLLGRQQANHAAPQPSRVARCEGAKRTEC